MSEKNSQEKFKHMNKIFISKSINEGDRRFKNYRHYRIFSSHLKLIFTS